MPVAHKPLRRPPSPDHLPAHLGHEPRDELREAAAAEHKVLGVRHVDDVVVGRAAEAQLDRLVPVRSVHDLTEEGPHIETELALVKINATGEQRVEALRIADIFNARVDDTTLESFVFRVAGTSETIDRFIDLMRALGETDIARTGVVAISRGPETT